MGRYLKGPFPLGSVLCTYERPLEIQYNTLQCYEDFLASEKLLLYSTFTLRTTLLALAWLKGRPSEQYSCYAPTGEFALCCPDCLVLPVLQTSWSKFLV